MQLYLGCSHATKVKSRTLKRARELCSSVTSALQDLS